MILFQLFYFALIVKRISETEFMEFTEIENHDDYYSVDENGFVHVQDQRGFYIIYDVSLSDLK